jgi:hypothetical protein
MLFAASSGLFDRFVVVAMPLSTGGTTLHQLGAQEHTFDDHESLVLATIQCATRHAGCFLARQPSALRRMDGTKFKHPCFLYHHRARQSSSEYAKRTHVSR